MWNNTNCLVGDATLGHVEVHVGNAILNPHRRQPCLVWDLISLSNERLDLTLTVGKSSNCFVSPVSNCRNSATISYTYVLVKRGAGCCSQSHTQESIEEKSGGEAELQFGKAVSSHEICMLRAISIIAIDSRK